MLGVSSTAVAEWGAGGGGARWLPLVQRVRASRAAAAAAATQRCAACAQPLAQVLKFKCSKCHDIFFCEKCYLYDKDLTIIPGHKKSHVVYEIIDGEMNPTECNSFMKGIKRFFFCTKNKKKKNVKKRFKISDKNPTSDCRRNSKPTIFTSTVSKASGNTTNNPATTLQDIITQLENQNKTLKELSEQLQSTSKDNEDVLKEKVDTHYNQISTQINRLKMLKENINNVENIPPTTKSDKADRPQAFDLFSPIPVEEKQSKVTENANQPRVLSMDSGNFSVTSKHNGSQNLLTVSGDALKPVVIHTSDTISTVSMNDMSHWYNETDASELRKRTALSKARLDTTAQSICATEQKYAADIRSVENSNDKMKELNADLDTVLDRLQQILTNNFAMDDSCFDNTQLRETANEMEGLLGTLIRGVEQRATLNATRK